MRTGLFLLVILCACGDPEATSAPKAADVGTAADAGSGSEVVGEDADSGPATCVSDKQCAASKGVCDTASGKCVQCNDLHDCDNGFACKAHHCLAPAKPCVATKECALDQVCDKIAGFCVGCMSGADCDPGQGCVDTVCVAMACPAGLATCAGNTVHACKADGSGFVDTACASTQVCQAGACQATICTPGAKTCEGAKVMQCNDSGLANSLAEDCAASGKSCSNGGCLLPTQECAPGTTTCQPGGLGSCKSDGSGWTVAPCPMGESCAGGVCQAGQAGFQLHGGFAAIGDAQGGGFRLIEQGWLSAGACSGNFCSRGGFQP